MENDRGLKEIEQKVFRSYFHDGLWDIYGGFILLGFGLTMVTGLDYLIIIFAVAAVILLLFRKRIIVPRLGRVKFSSERQVKTIRSMILAVVVLTFTALIGGLFFVLFSTNSVPEWLDVWMKDYFLIGFGGVIALFVIVAAYIVGVWRYFLYAVFTFIAFIIAGIMRPNDMEGIPIVVAGAIILVLGAIILTRFLKKYPLPPKEIGSA